RTGRRARSRLREAVEIEGNEGRIVKIHRSRSVILRETAHTEPTPNHEPLTRSGGKAEPRLKIGPIGLYARGCADPEGVAILRSAVSRQNRIEVGTLSLGGGNGTEMVPTQADVQRKPGYCPPVVLHVDVGLPEAEVLTFGI